MFTGLVQHRAKVVEVAAAETGVRLALDADGWAHVPSHGDSISVNGCCLTVVEAKSGGLRFNVIHQTLRSTTLGDLREGDEVNIEHAATPTTLLGGHIVQGHVDGVGSVQSVLEQAGEYRLRIAPPVDLMEFVSERGSIAVDGVSLTIASTCEAWFDVALIPTTLELTTLGALRADSRVNLEVDYLAKIVVQWLKRRA